ncbi:LytTR family DNA-binding domain-containing protein [uncultured Oscillibacter sp.]|uniref:LytTR family DNA-binding domain-containing protein n=1 Tax=uncultured Oscillibacter sp. TaxID=876091 RepID=UPI0025E48F02|nr:LytTR family DNA-binding domain-containing protein [uncultured Oscillibacter sp.]
MKITVEHRDVPENEVVLRCRELDGEMLHILSLLRSGMQTLCAWTEEREPVFLRPGEVLYAESVEERTWLYCEEAVWPTALTLLELESRYEPLGFCRASRSMVVNLHGIRKLRSCAAGRIEATMRNGERVLISRHYAPLLRERLGM